jgi:two-component system response regulator EvgA
MRWRFSRSLGSSRHPFRPKAGIGHDSRLTIAREAAPASTMSNDLTVLLRVVIVDDQPSFRSAARALLGARGHVVVADVGDRRAALEAVAQFDPDVVLLDVSLGEESGLDVARSLVSGRPGIAVVLMSIDETVSQEGVRASGARGFVPKAKLFDADLEKLCRAS